MAADSSATKRIVGLAFAGLGVVANIIGVAGAIGDWGSETTQVVLGPAEAAGAAEETTTTAAPATTTTAAPAETAEEFLAALGAALQTGDIEYLFARLHPENLVRYTEEECRAALEGYIDPTYALAVQTEYPPSDYTWVTDNLTTVIPETVAVDVVVTSSGGQRSATVHITSIDGQYRWFTDCTPAAA